MHICFGDNDWPSVLSFFLSFFLVFLLEIHSPLSVAFWSFTRSPPCTQLLPKVRFSVSIPLMCNLVAMQNSLTLFSMFPSKTIL